MSGKNYEPWVQDKFGFPFRTTLGFCLGQVWGFLWDIFGQVQGFAWDKFWILFVTSSARVQDRFETSLEQVQVMFVFHLGQV